MKKYIILGLSVALAVFCTTSCNQELLNIQQKGVIAYEDFYQTDEDAQSALTAVYHQFINMINSQGSNNPAWNVVVNACGDELYWGGGKKDGSSSGAQDMNEFRNTYDSTVPHIRVVYKGLYSIIYKCNLVIDNFWGESGELCDSPIKKNAWPRPAPSAPGRTSPWPPSGAPRRSWTTCSPETPVPPTATTRS